MEHQRENMNLSQFIKSLPNLIKRGPKVQTANPIIFVTSNLLSTVLLEGTFGPYMPKIGVQKLNIQNCL